MIVVVLSGVVLLSRCFVVFVSIVFVALVVSAVVLFVCWLYDCFVLCVLL